MANRNKKLPGICNALPLALILLTLFSPIFPSPFPRIPTEKKPEYQTKAVFLGKIIAFIYWPKDSAFNDPRTPIVIGVIGKNPFEAEIDGKKSDWLDIALTGRGIDGRKVEVRHIRDLENIKHCSVLFISRSEEERLRDILNESQKYPILTVGDAEIFSRRGVHLNLLIKDDRTIMELDEPALNASQLVANTHLLKAAVLVNTKKK